MKKVININFQGQVIPIEETAYEMLQNYVDSLRRYFANEEGRDEIINDIENRIAELFAETLKKGSACITDPDVERIMQSMGRPEDFEQDADTSASGSTAHTAAGGSTYGQAPPPGSESANDSYRGRKRLYRDEQDKILGGVASGLANYLNLDPAIVRVVFALLGIFGGSGFLIYIILWIVLPSRSLVTNIRKRLFRDPDDKVIAGVAGGLAKYFDISPAIPRIIFAAPFIFGIITSIGRSFFNPFPVFVGSFGGGTFILAYIILWIVLPEARTAAEKLEMRGERVDLNSIRDTVVNDLQGLKGRAEKMGSELSASAQRFGREVSDTFSEKASQLGADASQAARRSSSGLGNAIGILIKAFVIFIGGAIALALFVGLIALMGAGVGVMPLRDFILQGTTQHMLAWGTILLFLGVPIVALLVWFIRRLMGVRDSNKYIGYGFTALWVVGLLCFIGLLGTLNRSFSSQASVRETTELTAPASDRLIVDVGYEDRAYAYQDSWMDIEGLVSVNRDTLLMNNVKLQIGRSRDNNYRVVIIKSSKGSNRDNARVLADRIEFVPVQRDSVLYLPEYFGIGQRDKWRNQQVIVVLEVPVGKWVRVSNRVGDYSFYNIQLGYRRSWRDNLDPLWSGQTYYWVEENDMLMTDDGLEWDSERRDGKIYKYRNGRRQRDEVEEPSAPANPEPPAADTISAPGNRKDYRYQAEPTVDMYQAGAGAALPAHPLGAILRF